MTERRFEGYNDGNLLVKSTGERRFCRKCQIPKPDRAHHCSLCNVCILKMDHHCPWLGGRCVGLHNYHSFLLFLLYTTLLCIYVTIFTSSVLFGDIPSSRQIAELTVVNWALLCLVGFIFGLCVGGFGIHHLFLCCRNRTTIESMEMNGLRIKLPQSQGAQYKPDHHLSRSEREGLEAATRKHRLYDLGWKRNLKEVFGSNWKVWFIPTGRRHGDGIDFEINRANLERLLEISREIRMAPRERW